MFEPSDLPQEKRIYRVAVAQWAEPDGVAQDICEALKDLGHTAIPFLYSDRIPSDCDVVLTFAPWGRFLPLARSVGSIPLASRPTLLHWNLENPPDIGIPWPVLKSMAVFRSWVGSLHEADNSTARALVQRGPLRVIDARMIKYRYLGDYYQAFRMGWLTSLAETSQMFAEFYTRHGMPTFYVPWGTAPSSYKTLDLDRDIDVLWMGKRRTKQRSMNIDRVRRELASQGVTMHVVDGVENPLVYGASRTELISRSKISLNVMQVWYDNSFHMRFHMAAGNRSVVVSEHLPPHYPEYTPGVHYVSTEPKTLSDTIVYYLEHEDERSQIAENAFHLVTTQMTFRASVSKLMDLARKVREGDHDRNGPPAAY